MAKTGRFSIVLILQIFLTISSNSQNSLDELLCGFNSFCIERSRCSASGRLEGCSDDGNYVRIKITLFFESHNSLLHEPIHPGTGIT